MTILKSENASAAIMVDNYDNFLLQKRDNKKSIFFPGHLGLFGGAKELGETYEKALKRELIEEIGFSPLNVKFFIKLSFKFENKKIHRYFYICKIKLINPKKIILNEGEAYKIYKKSRLIKELNSKNLFVPYDQLALWFYINRKKII